MLQALAAGRVLDCTDGERRAVDAALVRRCCHELKGQVDLRGIRIANAAITGPVDLARLDVTFPLRFEECTFDSAVNVEDARLYDLAITGCERLPGLLANGVRIRRDLDLSRTHVAGACTTTTSISRRAAIWLCESDIGGRLLCVNTRIEADGERSIQADRMHVGGAVRFLEEFDARGEVRLIGVRIEGPLDLAGARISGDAVALDLSDATIGGSVFLITGRGGRQPDIQGRVDMTHAEISGQFLVRDARLVAPRAAPAKSGYSRLHDDSIVLMAERLNVGGELAFEGNCVITGGMDLSMSTMSRLLIDKGCALKVPGKTALDLTNAEILSKVIIGETVPVEGTLQLTGVTIHGDLCLKGTQLSNPDPAEGKLIAAESARIDGEVQLQGLQAVGGGLGFRSAVIGSAFEAADAHVHNPAGETLSLIQANLKGSVHLTNGFESTGRVLLNRATVEGRLLCTKGIFDCPAPTEDNPQRHAIEVVSASVNGGMDLWWDSISPSVAFTSTRTSFLADDPANWPSHYQISGFSYDRLEQSQEFPSARIWDPVARSEWLGRQTDYDAGPYEQAARVFRQHGYADGAKAILIAQRKHARSAMSGRGRRPRRVLDGAYSLILGYGYRPARVLWLIAALLVIVTASLEVPAARATMRATTSSGVVFTTAGPLQGTSLGQPADACGEGQVRCFNPALYAIDTVIPLLTLNERSTWYPDTGTTAGRVMQWWLNAATILGWLLSSVFVLALASLARSE